MALLELNNICFRYPDENQDVLNDLSMSVKEGEFVLLCGPSGCGKTTLLRMLKPGLAPAGDRKGALTYNGKPQEDYPEIHLAQEIGMVFQDPENQIVMEEVMQELVFGLENLGFSTGDMRKRVAEMVHFFGLGPLLDKKTFEISGGQKQMLNLASVLLLKPKLLLLDEPTAQLDPVSAKQFIGMIQRLNEEFGITVILVEHRLEELFAIADRTLFMENGTFTNTGNPREVIRSIWLAQHPHFIDYLPSVSTLFLEHDHSGGEEFVPVTVKEGKDWVGKQSFGTAGDPQSENGKPPNRLMHCKGLYFQYEKEGGNVLQRLFLDVYEGELLTLVGGNGSGKSTLLKTMAGLLKPQRGQVFYKGKKMKMTGDATNKIAYLPQNPKLYFIEDTVEKEMKKTGEQLEIGQGNERIEALTSYLGLEAVRDRHPYDLSGGEMQKAALACVLLKQPEVLLVDEPTKGLDPDSKVHFANLLERLRSDGVTIVMVSHDIEFAARFASRCAMMFQGEITATGEPKFFFKGNTFYTTVINRVTRDSSVPEVLTAEEARLKWHTRERPSL